MFLFGNIIPVNRVLESAFCLSEIQMGVEESISNEDLAEMCTRIDSRLDILFANTKNAFCWFWNPCNGCKISVENVWLGFKQIGTDSVIIAPYVVFK